MNSILVVLAQVSQEAAETAQKCSARELWPQLTWYLTIGIAVMVVAVFLRQKKIAQNQVDLAKLIGELLDKK